MRRESLGEYVKKVVHSLSYGDVYANGGESWSIEFDMDKLKSIETREFAAIGVRVFEKMDGGDYGVGQGFCNHEEDISEMICRAREQAKWGERLWVELPHQQNYPVLDIHREVKLEKEQAIAWSEWLVKELKQIDKRNKVFVSVDASDEEVWVANTVGFFGSYRERSFSLSCGFSHVGDSGELLYLGESEYRFDTDFQFRRFVDKMSRLYEWGQNKAEISSGYYPVIFSPEALSTVLDPLLIALNGSSLYKKICRWEGMEGKQVADSRFTLRDDPFCLEVGEVYPFDDEGIVPTSLPLIEKGILKNFIYDLATAKRLDTKTTGHGRRSVSSLPQPAFSSLIVEPGDMSLEDMIQSIEKGLLVYGTLGEGMSNVVAGDFSVNVELGFLIECGKVRGRVKDTMIRGNSFELINSLLFIGSEQEIVHGMKLPPIAFDRVSVTGDQG